MNLSKSKSALMCWTNTQFSFDGVAKSGIVYSDLYAPQPSQRQTCGITAGARSRGSDR